MQSCDNKSLFPGKLNQESFQDVLPRSISALFMEHCVHEILPKIEIRQNPNL